MNLRDEHEPYKALIATVILDKLKSRVRTVVNKTQSHGGPYRTFAMEVLAGDPVLETTLKENGCTFALDLSRVYWNSRLETEHRRIVDSLSADDVLADAFCGIGPFALPAVKLRKCKVYANDLNPSSFEYLKLNAAKNGVSMNPGSKFVPSCECARTFLTRLVREENVPITRVVMNFPSGAPEFLDVFSGLYVGLEVKSLPMPTIHCYCFARGDEWEDDAKRRVLCILGLAPDDTNVAIDLREVRDVAPNKRHVCVTFQVPSSVAYRVSCEHGSNDKDAAEVAPNGETVDDPETKRRRKA
jgi:tRNA (guanine37-N1)-methyltransferase